MTIPLQVTFTNMTPSNAVRDRIEKLTSRINRFHKHIIACRVAIRAPSHRQRKGRLFHVSIDLTVPGHEIAVNRNPPEDHAHEDIYVAIRDAFAALTRKLEDTARETRGAVKFHEDEPRGRVTKLFPAKGFGFIVSENGDEVYFHSNSVRGNAFNRLRVGSSVLFQAELGTEGMQATIVKPSNRRRTTR